jgi:hypothetical protein
MLCALHNRLIERDVDILGAFRAVTTDNLGDGSCMLKARGKAIGPLAELAK